MTAAPSASASRWRRSFDFLYAAGGQLAALCVLAILILMVYASVGRTLDWRVSWISPTAHREAETAKAHRG